LIVENTAAFSAAVEKEAAAPQQNTRAEDANWQSFLFFHRSSTHEKAVYFQRKQQKEAVGLVSKITSSSLV